VPCVVGDIVQDLARDSALTADLLLSCSDTTHSRAAVSELAYRYLLPAIDVGVLLDGAAGNVEAEVVQVTVYAPGLPCAYCRDLIDPWRVAVELMDEEERARRSQQAREAEERGDRGGAYWQELPQLHTVGHLTTLAGSLAAAYATGWLTNRFGPPANFFQFDILARDLAPVTVEVDQKVRCPCNEVVGYADQGGHRSVIGTPGHWAPAFIL